MNQQRLFKTSIIFLLVMLILSSCARTPPKLDPNYKAYLQAVQNYHPKLVEIKAQPGQTIELKGVQEFVVYMPGSKGGQIAIHKSNPDPAVLITHDVLSTGLHVATGVLPSYFGWKYGSSVLKKAFDTAGNHYNGPYTNVGGDYTLGDKIQGDKYNATGDIVTGTKYNATGDVVTGTKYNATGDVVTGTKYNATGDVVTGTKYNATGDVVTGTKYQPTGDVVTGGTNANNSYNTPEQSSTSDNSTTP